MATLIRTIHRNQSLLYSRTDALTPLRTDFHGRRGRVDLPVLDRNVSGFPRTVRITAVISAVLVLIFLLNLLASPSARAVTLRGQTRQCPVLRFGSKGPCVAALQRQLDRENVQPLLEADGIFGELTVDAVKNFQRSRGLVADGIVGPRTAHALIALPSKPEPRSGPKKMIGSIINLTDIALFGVFILAALIIVSLGRRVRRIRVTAGGVVKLDVDFGPTEEEVQIAMMSSRVQLQAAVAASNNSALNPDIDMPSKVIEGRAERLLNYPPPPRREALPPPPPPSWLPSPSA